MNKLKTIAKIIGKVVTILSVVFVVIAITKLDINFNLISRAKPMHILRVCFISSLLICFAEYLMALAWKYLLDFFSGKHSRYKDAACVYAKANIGKYLPGNVMHYIERNLFATNLGLKQKDIIFSTIIEVIGITSISIILSLVFAYNHLKNVLLELVSFRMMIFFGGISIIAFLLTHLIYVKKKDYILIFLKNRSPKEFIKVLIHISAVYTLFLVFGAAIMMFLLYSLYEFPLTFANISLIGISYTIAWVLGFVVPGAPGGIGIREFVLLFLLGNTFPSDISMTAILLHRLITILGDFEAYVITFILKKHINYS